MSYSAASLIDVYTRTQSVFQKLMHHCGGFTEAELARELEGFGYASVRHQLHHVLGAEQYWVGVLRGLMLIAEDPADMASIAALGAFRERVTDVTTGYLHSASDDDLNTPRSMTTWGGNERELTPAHVILRTQTHVFQHQGQVAAMCRLLGRPIPPGLDFPLG